FLRCKLFTLGLLKAERKKVMPMKKDMLKRFITYLRRQSKHSEAFQFVQILTKLDYNSSDSEGESSEAYAGSVIGSDINLNEITVIRNNQSKTNLDVAARTFLLKEKVKHPCIQLVSIRTLKECVSCLSKAILLMFEITAGSSYCMKPAIVVTSISLKF
ncbi:hypothetical protein BDFB_011513, partial [Asbolus verrucosus]